MKTKMTEENKCKVCGGEMIRDSCMVNFCSKCNTETCCADTMIDRDNWKGRAVNLANAVKMFIDCTVEENPESARWLKEMAVDAMEVIAAIDVENLGGGE